MIRKDAIHSLVEYMRYGFPIISDGIASSNFISRRIEFDTTLVFWFHKDKGAIKRNSPLGGLDSIYEFEYTEEGLAAVKVELERLRFTKQLEDSQS